MNHIDTIYYINLDHRIDRKEKFLECMNDLQVPKSKIERISAIYEPNLGALGCTKSHMLALETFINSDKNTCIIFEDDFTYKNKETFWINITKFFELNIPFDIIQLSYNTSQYSNCVVYKAIDTKYDFLKKAEITITASSYIITKQFAPKLLENFKESAQLHTRAGIKTHNYCHDVYWNLLKSNSEWYLIYPPPGYQHNSYSDIENTYVNYNI
jgi:GR25 family glycosyltransferase involved in LPS biosynthesis